MQRDRVKNRPGFSLHYMDMSENSIEQSMLSCPCLAWSTSPHENERRGDARLHCSWGHDWR